MADKKEQDHKKDEQQEEHFTGSPEQQLPDLEADDTQDTPSNKHKTDKQKND